MAGFKEIVDFPAGQLRSFPLIQTPGEGVEILCSTGMSDRLQRPVAGRERSTGLSGSHSGLLCRRPRPNPERQQKQRGSDDVEFVSRAHGNHLLVVSPGALSAQQGPGDSRRRPDPARLVLMKQSMSRECTPGQCSSSQGFIPGNGLLLFTSGKMEGKRMECNPPGGYSSGLSAAGGSTTSSAGSSAATSSGCSSSCHFLETLPSHQAKFIGKVPGARKT